MSRFWIGVASRDHVRRGVAGGFAQLGHGKAALVRRLTRGDWIVYYSPRTAFEAGDPLRAFTAVGEIVDESAAQVAQSADFRPFRRSVRYETCGEAPIGPLLDRLSFTRGRASWGLAFRRASFEISRADFELIARAMDVSVPAG